MNANPFSIEDEDVRLDAALINLITQMGTSGDRSEHTTVGRSHKIPKQDLEELYKVPICRRVVRARADSAVLKGWHLTLGGEKSDQKIIPKFTKYHDKLKVKESFHEAQIQANIYGGAVIVIVANDGKNASEPLDITKIKSITALEVLDRYKIQPEIDIGINPSNPEFYRLILPEFLQRKFSQLFPNQGANFKIHASRIIRFDGISYTPDMLGCNEGWGGSILESLWEDYRDWKTALKALGAMLHDCSVFVYKLKGLAQMVKTQDEGLLKSRLRLMRMMISVFGGFAADAEGENVEFPSRTFAGVDQVANQLRDAFIGSTGIPHDRLFGESPSGLGATGESEEKNWATDVASFQQTEWKPKLKDFGRLIFLAKDGPTGGKEPEDWDYEFPSLLQQSESEIVSTRSSQASIDNTYLGTGVLLPEEVRASRFGGSKYSIETVLDTKLFSKKQQEAQQQQFGGFDGFDEEELPPEEASPEEETTNQDSLERYDALYSQLPKDEQGRVKYLGKWWKPNKPVASSRQGKKRMVLAKKGDRVKLIHYGAEGYQHNYSPEAKKNYLTRSAGIKDKEGNLTKDDPFSPNYWARKDLWNKRLPADGRTLYQGRGQKAEGRREETNGNGKPCGDGFIPGNKECHKDSDSLPSALCPLPSAFKKDAADPPKKIVNWNGLSIGVTHQVGDTRFPLARPIVADYGHLRRSYGSAPDGKALDFYLGENLESPNVFKVRQLDPQTGMPDEDKYFIGFEDAASARDCFTYHAGRDRFGGIEPIDQNQLQVYRKDNCGISEPKLNTGVRIFDSKLLVNVPPDNHQILGIVASTFPEQVLGLGDWKYKADGTVDGEFYTPIGVYGFGIKNNYCGYSWKRELSNNFVLDSDPVRPGYTWVNDPTVKGGGYFRKGEAKKDPESASKKKNTNILKKLNETIKKINNTEEMPEGKEGSAFRKKYNDLLLDAIYDLDDSHIKDVRQLKSIIDEPVSLKDYSGFSASKIVQEEFDVKFGRLFQAENDRKKRLLSSNYSSRLLKSTYIKGATEEDSNSLSEWEQTLRTDKTFSNFVDGSSSMTKESDSFKYANAVINVSRKNPNAFRGLRDEQGKLQAGAIVYEDYNRRNLFVQYLASAPHNMIKNHPDKAAGAGVEMIAKLVQESKELGFEGKLVLGGQSGTGYEFYKKCGFEGDVLPPEKAEQFLQKLEESKKDLK